ncbi:hypothetical protein [Salinibacterium sp.]|uniref:hypothetical protein n=1 Tax=Salinibacterium sp. TaxID=1915057 RepID=UPI00286B70FF|nr:hypothetical protein [Salinibacterium sp.]
MADVRLDLGLLSAKEHASSVNIYRTNKRLGDSDFAYFADWKQPYAAATDRTFDRTDDHIALARLRAAESTASPT